MSKHYIGAKSFTLNGEHFRLVISRGFYTCDGCKGSIKNMDGYYRGLKESRLCLKCGNPHWTGERTDECGYPVIQ